MRFEPIQHRIANARPTHPLGFTLIELLVVIAIVSLLIAILLPALSKARQVSKDLLCMTNLRSIGTTVQLYTNDNDEGMPCLNWKLPNGETNFDKTTWNVHLSQYTSKPITEYDNGSIKGTIFKCPVATGWLGANYGYNTSIPPPYGWDARRVHAMATLIKRPSTLRLVSDCTYISISGGTSNVSFRHTDQTAALLFADGHVGKFKSAQFSQIPYKGY